MKICGVDEAGRGSMLGPLVIAGISINKSHVKKLLELGVKDSKKLTPKTREDLYEKIISLVDNYYVQKISPASIDKSVKKNGLNHLEAKYMAKVITKLNADTSFVDSCDVNPQRFGKEISVLSNNKKIRSYHHADSKFLVVSAASIIAKVTRDRALEKIRKNNDIGSGYPSDPKTISFVKKFYHTQKTMPIFVRKSWKPSQKILNSIQD